MSRLLLKIFRGELISKTSGTYWKYNDTEENIIQSCSEEEEANGKQFA